METKGIVHGTNSRGYWLGWKCPKCKYKANDSIVVESNIQDYYFAKCDKCGETIKVLNP